MGAGLRDQPTAAATVLVVLDYCMENHEEWLGKHCGWRTTLLQHSVGVLE